MKDIMDILPRFQEIINDLEEIKKSVVKESSFDYESQDARMVALDSLHKSVLATGMWISCVNSLANKCPIDDGGFNKSEFLSSVNSDIDLDQTKDIMFNHLRLGFITLVHFKFDNLFYNILRNIDALPNRKGYWSLTDSILKECSLPRKGDEKDILTAFANLRNSLHGNGIHRTPNLEIEVNGTPFNFIENQKVECASWEDIIILLQANVDVLKKILMSKRVQKITTEITDDFASSPRAKP